MMRPLSVEEIHSMTVTEETLEALFVINKKAKQYARRATEAYEQGFGGMAKTDSLRKNALYRLKSYVLATLYVQGDIDEVQLHHINGNQYYCLQIGVYQFHTPVTEFKDSLICPHIDMRLRDEEISDAAEITDDTTEVKYLDDFSPSESVPEEMMSERDALVHLAEAYRSVNSFIHPFNDGRPIGWSYLPEYVEEGTVISESEFQAEHASGFLFAVGDSFETIEHGHVTIVNRYGKWLSRRFSREPILPRPVYDVELCDREKRKTGIRRERIMDDWRIHVDDLSDPLPAVDGPLAEQVDSYDLDFEPGDTLTLDRGFDEGHADWRVDHISIYGSLLEVHLQPCNEEWTEPLTPEEFVDDIVEITHE